MLRLKTEMKIMPVARADAALERTCMLPTPLGAGPPRPWSVCGMPAAFDVEWNDESENGPRVGVFVCDDCFNQYFHPCQCPECLAWMQSQKGN